MVYRFGFSIKTSTVLAKPRPEPSYLFHPELWRPAMYEYKTTGTCSTRIRFEIRDGRVCDLSFEDGCEGNLKALSILAEGLEARELIKRLKGVQCGSRGTSCADQLAKALEKAVGLGQN
jgi:uncharacterized protein (TIGR03905 family)